MLAVTYFPVSGNVNARPVSDLFDRSKSVDPLLYSQNGPLPYGSGRAEIGLRTESKARNVSRIEERILGWIRNRKDADRQDGASLKQRSL